MSNTPGRSFWNFWTTSGLLALITGVPTIILVLFQVGLIGGNNDTTPTATPRAGVQDTARIATPTDGVPPPLPTATPAVSAVDITGPWAHSNGGFVDFIPLAEGEYELRRYDSFGNIVGSGSATVEGDTVRLEGSDTVVGPFASELQISGNQMTGVETYVGGQSLVTLVRQ